MKHDIAIAVSALAVALLCIVTGAFMIVNGDPARAALIFIAGAGVAVVALLIARENLK